jgi:hypothetical protein
MLVADRKRQHGRFYTEGNPFVLKPFQKWVQRYGLNREKVLEPFAGKNGLIRALREIGLANKFTSCDIEPADSAVERRDTIANFPRGFNLCVSNPPWLAKNSAKRRGLPFPDTSYDDLYKHALALCLQNCTHVAVLVPATFLRSGLFRSRLDAVIFLHDQRLFADTENPVCLALFSAKPNCIEIYNDEKFVGRLDELEKYLPRGEGKTRVVFNHPTGDLGFIAFDDTNKQTIRFIPGKDLADYEVKFTSRMITRIKTDLGDLDSSIRSLNNDIRVFRAATSDVFLTPFKGLRKDGRYRRRMDYGLARDFILKYAEKSSRLRI